ncbi:YtxH domain-containing protein [Calidifontibacter indicus]|uniref:YtxH domain-containing protein n=1 Tax=Calidifontibacter indicus TaxID=419650 RepID=UPI003D72C3D1
MGKISFLAGFAAGYVLGARAGEQRYEQIKLQAGKAWAHPAVQEKVDEATQVIKERGPEVAAAAGQAAIKGAGTAAKSAVAAGYSAAKSAKSGPTVSGEIADDETAPEADTDSGSTKQPSATPEYVGDVDAKHSAESATDPGFDAN